MVLARADRSRSARRLVFEDEPHSPARVSAPSRDSLSGLVGGLNMSSSSEADLSLADTSV